MLKLNSYNSLILKCKGKIKYDCKFYYPLVWNYLIVKEISLDKTSKHKNHSKHKRIQDSFHKIS